MYLYHKPLASMEGASGAGSVASMRISGSTLGTTLGFSLLGKRAYTDGRVNSSRWLVEMWVDIREYMLRCLTAFVPLLPVPDNIRCQPQSEV